jgi:hypothetical protein
MFPSSFLLRALVSSSFASASFSILIVPFVRWQWFCQSVLFQLQFSFSTINQTKWIPFLALLQSKGTSCLAKANLYKVPGLFVKHHVALVAKAIHLLEALD